MSEVWAHWLVTTKLTFYRKQNFCDINWPALEIPARANCDLHLQHSGSQNRPPNLIQSEILRGTAAARMTSVSRTSQFEPYSGTDCTITSLVGASFTSASSSQGSIGSDGLSRLATKKIPTITIRITSRIIACLNMLALGSSLLVTNGCLLNCLISEQIFFLLRALRTRTCRSACLILALNFGDFKKL